MTKFYTAGNTPQVLTGPFITIGVWVNPEYESIVTRILKEYLYDYDTQKTRIRDLLITKLFTTLGGLNRLIEIHKLKKLPPPFILTYSKIEAYQINTRGISFCIENSTYSSQVEMRARLIDVEDSESVVISNENDMKNTEGLLCYLYANLYRYNWLRLYNNYYWKLRLINNWGNASEKHLKTLWRMENLPEFYLGTKTVEYMKKFCTERGIDFPKWYTKEVNSYERFNEYDGAVYALRL